MKRPSGVADVAWYDIERSIKTRDAEHRAELPKLQDDLLQAANREVMSAALIERLRGELGEAQRENAKFLHTLGRSAIQIDGLDSRVDALQAYARRAAGLLTTARHHLESAAEIIADDGGDEEDDAEEREFIGRIDAFLAAPPPAESTPVQRISMKETSWGGRYAVMQPSSTDPKQAACKTSGCGHPKEQHDFADDCTADDCTCAGFDPGDAPSPFGPCPTCSSPAAPPDDIRARLDAFEIKLAQLQAGIAALEAKGEPGTHCRVAECCTEGRLP